MSLPAFSKMRNMTSIVFLAICFSGLVYQVTDVSELYLSYSTRSDIKITIPFKVSSPSLSLCVRYQDIVDLEKLSLLRNHTMVRPLDPVSNHSVFFESHFTVRELFELTPGVEEFFGLSENFIMINGTKQRYSCMTRQPGAFVIQHHTAKVCQTMFQMKKYIHREFMCYKMAMVTDGRHYDLLHGSFTKEWFGLMFQFILNADLFGYVNSYTVFVHEDDSSDLFDSSLTKALERDVNDSFGIDVKVSYYSTTTIGLPSPYDTNCFNGSVGNLTFETETEDTLRCVNEYLIDNIQQVSPMGHVYEPYDLKIAPFSRTSDVEIFEKALNACRIDYEVCYLKVISSRVVTYHDDVLQVSLYWPQDTCSLITSHPRMALVEYLLFIGSCIGFWLGFSFVSFLFQLAGVCKNVTSRVLKTPTQVQIRDNVISQSNLRRHLTPIVNQILLDFKDDLFQKLDRQIPFMVSRAANRSLRLNRRRN